VKDLGERGIRVLADVVRGAQCYRLAMGDLEAAVVAVSDVVRSGAR
jgi:hypothetical protein